MNLTDERGHRVLKYIAAASKHGYLLSRDELEEYARAPSVKTGTPVAFEVIGRLMRTSMAFSSPESTTDWLERVRWIKEVDETRITITPLGKAVLAALDEDERLSDDLPAEVVLDPSDPVAYARVIGVIADAGPAALVDPYFDIDRLLEVVQRTNIERILTGPDHQGSRPRLPALEQAFVSFAGIDRALELRTTNVFHDRLVIAEDGRVWTIGTSLGGVGKKLSVMTQFRDGAAANALRAEFEKAWTNATPVAAITPAEREDEPPDELAAAGEV